MEERNIRETKLSEELKELNATASRRQQNLSSHGSELTQLKHELDLAYTKINVMEGVASNAELKLQEAVANAKVVAAASLVAQTRSSTEQMAARATAQRMSLECGMSIADLLLAKAGSSRASNSS